MNDIRSLQRTKDYGTRKMQRNMQMQNATERMKYPVHNARKTTKRAKCYEACKMLRNDIP